MNPDLRKALTFFGVVGALALAVAVLGSRLLGAAAGAEAAILAALKDTEEDTFTLPIAGSAEPLVATEHFFERFAVEADYDRRTAVATTTLDFEGTLGETRVSSLGFERVPFRYEEREWRPAQGWAPQLSGIVSALERRRVALVQGDLAALAKLSGTEEQQLRADPKLASVLALKKRSYRATAWMIRSEREEILVTEEYRLRGETPDRPVDEKGSRSLRIQDVGGEFMFASGLM